MLRVRRVVLALLVSCAAWPGCARPPAPVDVDALVAARGPVEARRDLQIRVAADPRDVAAWLALAALADAAGRPGEAIAALEAVVALGGPLGVRWRSADQARLGRLIAARGHARLRRGAASATADLERARSLGATVDEHALAAARAAGAIAALRHADAAVRDRGRRTLSTQAGEPAWAGARPDATPAQRGQFGAWLWQQGARRAAWDELAAWHAATGRPRDPALLTAYLVAARWWIPLDRPAPPAEDLIGPARCAFVACPLEEAAPRPIAAPRAPYAGDARDARDEAAARHASLTADAPAATGPLRAIAAAYRREPEVADRLGRDAVAAAVDAASMHAALGALFDALGDPARARAAWQAAVDASPEPAFLRGLALAQAIQGDPDAALVNATHAAAASGDPAVVWVAVARSLAAVGKYVHALDAARSAIDLAGPETLGPALDLASATSRALGRDAQAAALAAQRARLVPGGHPATHDVRGGPGGARPMGGPGKPDGPAEHDPADAAAALAAHAGAPSSATVAGLWVAARWNPRSVELRAALLAATPPGDPRRAAVLGELVDLAGDRDPDLRLAAAIALQRP